MADQNKDELQSQIHYRLIEELSASETRYRELVELLQEVVFECDEQGKLTFLNRAWQEILGYSIEESLNRPITDFVNPREQQAAIRLIANAKIQNSDNTQDELEFYHQDGNIVWLQMSVRARTTGVRVGSLYDVSSRKLAEIKLRDSESMSRAILEAMPDLMFQISDDGIFLDLSTEKHKAFSFPIETFIYRHFEDVLPFEVVGKLRSAFDDVKQTGRLHTFEYRMPGAKGDHKDFEVRVSQRSGDDFFLITIRDISQQKLAEQRQKILRYFAGSLLSTSSIEEVLWDVTYSCISQLGWEDCVIYLVDSKKGVLVQKAAYGPGKASGYEIVNPITIPIGKGIVGAVARTGHPEIVHDVTKDKRYIVDDKARGSEIAMPIVHGGEVIGVIDSEHSQKGFYTHEHLSMLQSIASLCATKITQSVAQAKIEEEQKRLDIILQNIGNGVVVLDSTRKIIIINDRARVLFHLDQRNPAKLTLKRLLNRCQQNGKHLLDSLYKESFRKLELILQDRTETVLSVTGTTFLDVDGKSAGNILVFTDITKEKETDRMKTDFVSSVSHELRTPLSSILGFSSTILRDEDMPADTRTEFIKIIHEESERLARLIEDVLSLSRIEKGGRHYNLKRINIESAVRETFETYQAQALEKGIKTNLEVTRNLPMILAAEDAIKQILVNLLANAVKFTDRGGSLSVSVRGINGFLQLTVEDTGMGIPQKDLEKVFDKFYRVHRKGMEIPGTGLGLSIVREIVEAHQGTIEVSSKQNNGTRLVILFPTVSGE